MKQIGIWCLVLLGILIGIPTLVVYTGGHYSGELLQSVRGIGDKDESKEAEAKRQEDELIGAIAKMASPTESEEVLKAYAVILRTYKLRRQLGIVSQGSLAIMSKEEMQDKWGKDYTAYYTKLKKVVADTANEVMYANNELIEPIYHKESAGMTRAAVSLYKQDISYLQPVESKADTVRESFGFTQTEFVQKLQDAYSHLSIQAEALTQQIQIVAKDQAGYIESLQIGNLLIDGETLRKILGLPSACFTVTQSTNGITCDVKGIGHGIGLSQNGASAMALEGATYKEILSYYYTGIEIKTNN
ncbi:MAG: SpoIID/LytB domain-containing protein [Niameybacter sp.]